MKPLLALWLSGIEAGRLHKIEKQMFPHLKNCGIMHGKSGKMAQNVKLQ